MKVIVPMAGEGSRFRTAGVDVPKHEIRVKDRTMFEWAMRSLDAFTDHTFVFVCRASHDAVPFLNHHCDSLGIDQYDVVELESLTDGQASTVMRADDHVDPTEAVGIYNIDTYAEPGALDPDDITGDGWIPVFEKPGERWSFVRLCEDGGVVEVSEKEKISNLATIGFYYFDRWQSFTDAFEARGTDVAAEYGETYVAPLYNDLVEDGRIVAHEVQDDRVHVLGTPEDVQTFDPEFTERYDL